MLASAWLSYALIAALQMKILWDIWRFRDLTTGDTTSYFAGAYRWYANFAVNIVWSPLYTAFYGTVYLLTHDIYTATNFHRVIIVMAATLGVLTGWICHRWRIQPLIVTLGVGAISAGGVTAWTTGKLTGSATLPFRSARITVEFSGPRAHASDCVKK